MHNRNDSEHDSGYVIVFVSSEPFLVSLYVFTLECIFKARRCSRDYLRQSCCHVPQAHPAARFSPEGTRLVGRLQ